MRLSIVLLVAISCLIISISASPIQIVEKSKEVKEIVPNEGRQQNAAVPAGGDDDDDEDDDDGKLELT